MQIMVMPFLIMVKSGYDEMQNGILVVDSYKKCLTHLKHIIWSSFKMTGGQL